MFRFHTFPEIHIGPLTLYTFGLCVAVGVLVGAYATARRNLRFGVKVDDTQSSAMWLVLAGLVGARLTWVVTNWSQVSSPLDVIAVWEGGMQFSGGFIAALLVAPFAVRKITSAGASRLALMDSAALGLAIGQLFGRIGCISVGEHLGSPTNFFLGWTYLGGTTRELGYIPGQTYHNTAIYEFLWLLPLIGLLLWIDRGRGNRQVRPGTLLGTFIVGYAACRFGTDFLRINDKTVIGLTGAQFMCAAVFPVGVWLLVRGRRNQTVLTDVSPAHD